MNRTISSVVELGERVLAFRGTPHLEPRHFTAISLHEVTWDAGENWQDAPMSISAAHADAFYVEAIERGEVWGIRDDGGFPAPANDDGQRTMPFWSLRSRAESVIAKVEAYAHFAPEPISLEIWRERWLAGLANDGVHVGLNWSGSRATGFDLAASEVEQALSARM